jgi:ubiquinone/menaquinone biosynthesis C-methylase UbiE
VTIGPGQSDGREVTDSQRQFSQVAEAYRQSPTHADPVSLARLLALAELRPNHRVLDVATGTGNVALAAAPQVAEVVGLDITPQMLEQARQLAAEREIRNVTFLLGDAEQLPFPAASFDRVLVRSAPHHFKQLITALTESYRVLRPGGVFAVSDCSPPPVVRDWLEVVEVGRDPSHFRSRALEEWRALLQSLGKKKKKTKNKEKKSKVI